MSDMGGDGWIGEGRAVPGGVCSEGIHTGGLPCCSGGHLHREVIRVCLCRHIRIPTTRDTRVSHG